MITIELTAAQLSLTLKLLHLAHTEIKRDQVLDEENREFGDRFAKRVDAEYEVLRTKYLTARSRP